MIIPDCLLSSKLQSRPFRKLTTLHVNEPVSAVSHPL